MYMHIPLKKIKELTEKKYRTETKLFLVEGEKNILELLRSDFEVVTLLGTVPFLNIIRTEILSYEKEHGPLTCIEATENTLVQTGTLLSNNTGIAVVRQKDAPSVEAVITSAQDTIVLILDDIRDPGNLGTIIRTADWYGVTHIVASNTTTDCYNPKVIGATMGSFTRMSLLYTDLDSLFELIEPLSIPVLVSELAGLNTHTEVLPQHGFLLMGSESHGASKASRQHATHTVTIPRFGKAESLNVSVATGILLDTIRRF